jgi:hypothetical protein
MLIYHEIRLCESHQLSFDESRAILRRKKMKLKCGCDDCETPAGSQHSDVRRLDRSLRESKRHGSPPCWHCRLCPRCEIRRQQSNPENLTSKDAPLDAGTTPAQLTKPSLALPSAADQSLINRVFRARKSLSAESDLLPHEGSSAHVKPPLGYSCDLQLITQQVKYFMILPHRHPTNRSMAGSCHRARTSLE